MKKIVRKVLLFSSALLFLLALSACQGASTPSQDKPSAEATAEQETERQQIVPESSETMTSAIPTESQVETESKAESKTEASSSEPSAPQAEVGPYKDGVYTASAVGYAGGLKMEVTIEKGWISKIECLKHHEVGEQYYQAAFENVPPLIIKNQSTEGIDAVSGSTMTTKGIVKAVEKALKRAQ